MWWKIVWGKVTHKKLNSFLCILLMSMGVAIISMVLHLQQQLDKSFTKNIRGIDMVVGAKGSPLQLILSSVFQIDNPTGNIPLRSVNKLKENRLIKEVIPLSMGDNHKGYRIVGSQRSYLQHFEAELSEGELFTRPLEVVVGNTVAQNLQIKLGDEFESTHGLDEEGEGHDHEHFKVVGILKPSSSPLDKLIVCNLESIWDVHHQSKDEDKSVTSALVKFRSPMGLMTIPRNINENTVMQAALPSIEINRLLQLFADGLSFAQLLAVLIIIISAFSVFIAIYNTVKEGQSEMALMLSMGASRAQLFSQSLGQGFILGLLGFGLGLVFSKGLLLLSNEILSERLPFTTEIFKLNSFEIYLGLLALLLCVLAAAIPAAGIYKLNLSKTLTTD